MDDLFTGSEPSADYPLGGSLEPYDMERDMEVLLELQDANDALNPQP